MAEIRVYLFDNQRHQEHNIVAAARETRVPRARRAHQRDRRAERRRTADHVYRHRPGRPSATRSPASSPRSSRRSPQRKTYRRATAPPAAPGDRDRPRAWQRSWAFRRRTSPSTARAAVGGLISTKVRMPEGLDLHDPAPARQRSAATSRRSRTCRCAPPTASLVPLSSVASFTWTSEPPLIERQDRQRIVRVYANAANGAPIGLVTQKVGAAARKAGLRAGRRERVGVERQRRRALWRRGRQARARAADVVPADLHAARRALPRVPRAARHHVQRAGRDRRRVRHPRGAATCCTALFPDVRTFAGQSLNLFSMLGLSCSSGLVAKNGILLVDYANTLRGRGMALLDAIRESATMRFRPIVMTTVAMIAGMMPLALGHHRRRRVPQVDGHGHHRRPDQLAVPDAVPRPGRLRVDHGLGRPGSGVAAERNRRHDLEDAKLEAAVAAPQEEREPALR